MDVPTAPSERLDEAVGAVRMPESATWWDLANCGSRLEQASTLDYLRRWAHNRDDREDEERRTMSYDAEGQSTWFPLDAGACPECEGRRGEVSGNGAQWWVQCAHCRKRLSAAAHSVAP